MRARLFDRRVGSQDVTLSALSTITPGEEQLLWINLVAPTREELDAVWAATGLPAVARSIGEAGSTPMVERAGSSFWLQVVVVCERQRENASGTVLGIAAGENRVVSVEQEPLAFVDTLFDRSADEAAWGTLCSESFVAALLDWQLSTYFAAVADYENAIEHLENDVLTQDGGTSLAELRRLRRWASRLRRMLAPHRVVFASLSRPDFRPTGTRQAQNHFVALDTRFERAMDMVEHARDLVLGSFDLFSSKTALQTNERMKVLTFVTVLTGAMATVVGALGMNFQAAIFRSRDVGFWIVIGGLVLLTTAGMFLGKHRRWY